NIIERLQDPLMHIIRNSIDHGIETPEKRKAAGKKETGSIILKASYSGAYVLIEIEDDGAGIDKNKIIKTALGKGIISSANNMDNEKIYSLIFRPGFSTADRVTNLSGRGVGMDVVKKVIESMGGSVSIASSPGTGTSITLKIPLTLAIIEGMLIRVEDSYFIIPLSTVSECVEFRSENSHQKSRNLISLRGKLIPYIKLRDYFGIGGETPKLEQMVITYTGSSLIGFVADEVEGQYQTVIKSLGAVYRDLDGISGATILGDGRVALILDVLKLAYVNN
ncbi:MAG: chemotaxis protein CheA, partial [Spirochaetes bacterium]